jgi:hypothetical protein
VRDRLTDEFSDDHHDLLAARSVEISRSVDEDAVDTRGARRLLQGVLASSTWTPTARLAAAARIDEPWTLEELQGMAEDGEAVSPGGCRRRLRVGRARAHRL